MRQFGLAARALLAIILGIAAGLFFGPLCSVVKPVGDIFIMLLQMVVLPYICFSLIHGLGSLTPTIAKNLLKRGGGALLALWGLVFLTLYLLGHLIPPPSITILDESAKQTSLSENILGYLIPENPFYDLANNIVPAIAIFALIIGTGVMHLKQKEPLLSIVERGSKTLENIFLWLAHIAPIGIFAHIAYAVGTVHFEDLVKLEFYVVVYILACLFLTFVLLPILLRNMTHLQYPEIYRYFRRATFYAFATGVSSIAFPFIFGVLKKLAEKNKLEEERFHITSQTVVPLGYSFAQVGNCFIIFFILFASFYFRHPFSGMEKGLLYLLTVPLSIGASPAPISGIVFLLKQLEFPPQALEIFYETFSITIHFEVLLSVAGILTFIILVLFAYHGILEIKWKRLLSHLGIALASFAVLIFLFKGHITLKDRYQHFYSQLSIHRVIENPVEAEVITDLEDWEEFKRSHPAEISSESLLANILKTGIIRVGYDTRNIPYCYINEIGELAGYDIAYAYQLARDLDCKLTFVPVKIDELGKQLSSGYYDVAMSAIIMDEERLKEMIFTDSYDVQENVLIVPFAKKSSFLTYQGVVNAKGLKIAAIGAYKNVVQRHFPNAELVSLHHLSEFEEGKADALVWSKIEGFAWCLEHPGYVIVEYGELLGRKYFAYPIKPGSYNFLYFLNNWLYLKAQQGFKEEMQSYWLHGIPPKNGHKRWSIIRDELHWVK